MTIKFASLQSLQFSVCKLMFSKIYQSNVYILFTKFAKCVLQVCKFATVIYKNNCCKQSCKVNYLLVILED